MSEPDQSQSFGGFNLNYSVNHHTAEQNQQYEVEVINTALSRLLRTFPETILAIQEYLNDKSCTDQNFRDFIDEVGTERMALLRTSDQWEKLNCRSLESDVRSRIVALEITSAQLINDLRDKLEFTVPRLSPSIKSNISDCPKQAHSVTLSSDAGLQKTSSRKSYVSQHSRLSRQSDISTTSMKLKLKTEVAAVSIEQKYVQEQTERAKRQAAREASRTKQLAEEDARRAKQIAEIDTERIKQQRINQAEEEAERIENKAKEREAELKMKVEKLRAQLEVIEVMESEGASRDQADISLIPELNPRDKTENYVKSLPVADLSTHNDSIQPIVRKHLVASANISQHGSQHIQTPIIANPSTNKVSLAQQLPQNTPSLEPALFPSVADIRPSYLISQSTPFIEPVTGPVAANLAPNSDIVAEQKKQNPVNMCNSTILRESGTEMTLRAMNAPAVRTPNGPPTASNACHSRVPGSTFSLTPMGIADSNHTCTIDAINTVCEQMALARLPILEPQIFTGRDPLIFPIWKASFETLIHRKAITAYERLHLLSSYLGGEAREAIQGYLTLPSQDAYEQSYALLVKRYGDQFSLANSFLEKLRTWPKLSGADGVGLRRFVDFLRQCKTAMTSFKALAILNAESENAEISKKLPTWLSRRWTRKVADHRLITDEFPSFDVFVEFLSHEDDVANDPLARVLQAGNASGEGRRPNNRSGSFVTEVARQSVDGNLFGGCPFCKERHHLQLCDTFKRTTFEERQKFVRQSGLCFSCLGRGHLARDCGNRKVCDICKRLHPTVMHKEPLHQTADNPTISATTCAGHSSPGVMTRKSSMIVPVFLSHSNNQEKERLVYAMLDTQSDTSFIAEETVQALGLDGQEARLIISTMTSNEKPVTCKRFDNLNVRGFDSTQIISLPTVYSRRSIPANRDHIPSSDMINGWPHLEPLRKKFMSNVKCEVGLLIGYDCSRALAPREIVRAGDGVDGPFGMRTDLGWGIVGIISHSTDFSADVVGFSHRILAEADTGTQIVLPTKTKEVISPNDCLKLLEADFIDHNQNEEGPSLNERRFLRTMEDGIKINSSGHYSLPLPFNDRKEELFDNKALVVNRTMMLKKKLDRDPVYKSEYQLFMKDMFERGFAEKIGSAEVSNVKGVWYIPHFAVFHKVKKKLRVVFDCSAQYRGISLNDTLLKGPDYTNSLIGILCRFRMEPVAFSCDIEKMFYAFHVHPDDRDYLRFLWWENGDTSRALATYRMTTHIFGAVSSPSCATYGLRSIAREFEDEYGSKVLNFIGNDFYVDDGLKSVKDAAEAIDLIKQTLSVCRERGVRLHKFVSNSREVLDSLPASECAVESNSLNLDLTEPATERVLGMLWNVGLDSFQFKIGLKECLTTRRGILSTASSIFDPLGWIAPFTLRAKAILQQLCKKGLDWDESVPPNALKSWMDWCGEAPALQDLNLKRGFHHKDYKRDVSVQLHHFADASSQAYGACSYLRLVDSEERVSVHLVMAKARVAPLASVTIPRLELTAAVVAARLSILLQRELSYNNIEHFFWTDSRIVLGYISNDSKRFKVYVANRVQEIHNASNSSQWRHVASNNNPADLASRGMSAECLVKSSIWFHGPSFLHQKVLNLVSTVPVSVPLDDQEIRKVKVHMCNSKTAGNLLEVNTFNSFSCWKSLRRGVARVRCLIKKLKMKNAGGVKTRSSTQMEGKGPYLTPLSVEDLQEGERIIIKSVQAAYFPEEIGALLSGEAILKSSSLYKLDCFVDDFGLLRVGGRLRFAHLYQNYRHPIVLPGTTHVSTLIIRDCHHETRHQGRGMSINEVRSRGFWIVGLNTQVKRMIRSCVICRYLRGNTQTQKMSDLPTDRSECAPPFTYCGVDLFGPFLVKERRTEIKRYGVIFTCLASRAIHIEMAYSLSTDAFIQTLRKFISIRGPIRLLRCDNGTNFVGASRELAKSVASIQSEELRRFLLEQNCDFEFLMNPPSASHMGGAWERMIRVVRSVLNTLMDQHGTRLDDSSLGAFFYEAAAIINTRPLTLDHITDPNHPEPLTPNHLLTGKSKVVLPPPGQFSQDDTYSIKRWRCVQYLADQFWTRWRKEYLCYLQTRNKWQQKQRDMQVGDIVLATEDNAPRNDWRRGRVTETFASADGHIRRVKVRIGSDKNSENVLMRPVHKLVLLLPSEDVGAPVEASIPKI